MKKMIGLLLALAILVALTTVAFAATNGQLYDGDNEIELPYEAQTSTYTYTATESGTLYIMTTYFGYSSGDYDYWDNTDYMNEWAMYTSFTVDGAELEGAYYGSVEVVAGETYEFVWEHRETANSGWYRMGFCADLNLSYTDELLPQLGSEELPVELDKDSTQFPTASIEIGPGEIVYYNLKNLVGAYLTVTGENAYVLANVLNMDTNEWKEVPYNAANGVVTVPIQFDLYTVRIGNDGDEPATFTLDYYYLEGSVYRPAQLVLGENVAITEAENYDGYYFTWTSKIDGTLTLTFPKTGWWYEITNTTTSQQIEGIYSDSNALNSVSITYSGGDVIRIMVNTYSAAMLTVPGGELRFTAATDCKHSYASTGSTPGTCVSNAATTYTCKHCDYSYTKEGSLDPSNHEALAQSDAGKAATCTQDGTKPTWACTACQGIFADAEAKIPTTYEDQVISATGHRAGTTEKENETDATCGADGVYDAVVYCTVCRTELDRETVTVPATGQHIYATEQGKKESTCTEDGYVVLACSCGATETTALLAPGHTAGDTVKEREVPATCGADGSYDAVVYCTVCGAEIDRETVIVPATGQHVYATEQEKKEATCTIDGYVVMACGCGATENTALPAPGHAPGETVKENVVIVTCGTDGSYDEVVCCTVCGSELSRKSTRVPATGEHVYATEQEKKDATCTIDGYVVMACGCGETETTVLPAPGHAAGETVVEKETAATCTTDGAYDEAVYCTVCGSELSRKTIVVPATGHTAGETVRENVVIVTCGTDGSYDEVVYCTVCNAELSRKRTHIPATGEHVYATEQEKKEATCTIDGYVVMACGCGATETTVLPAPGHAAGETVVENQTAATCSDDGAYDEAVYCAVCGSELSRKTIVVPATGHTAGEAVAEDEIPVSCTEDGSYALAVYCTVCGSELSRETVVVPANGSHNYAHETERKEATCIEDGYVILACGCGTAKTTALPAAGHTAGEAVAENEIAATCDVDGSYELAVYCSICGSELSRETVILPATGDHNYVHETEQKEATCTEDGYVILSCDCGATETTTLPAAGHTAGEAVVENEIAASCDAGGSYELAVYCTACRSELQRESANTPALGHTAGQWVTVQEPTETEAGLKQKHCTVCNQLLEEMQIPPEDNVRSNGAGSGWLVLLAVPVAIGVAVVLIRKRKG